MWTTSGKVIISRTKWTEYCSSRPRQVNGSFWWHLTQHHQLIAFSSKFFFKFSIVPTTLYHILSSFLRNNSVMNSVSAVDVLHSVFQEASFFLFPFLSCHSKHTMPTNLLYITTFLSSFRQANVMSVYLSNSPLVLILAHVPSVPSLLCSSCRPIPLLSIHFYHLSP